MNLNPINFDLILNDHDHTFCLTQVTNPSEDPEKALETLRKIEIIIKNHYQFDENSEKLGGFNTDLDFLRFFKMKSAIIHENIHSKKSTIAQFFHLFIRNEKEDEIDRLNLEIHQIVNERLSKEVPLKLPIDLFNNEIMKYLDLKDLINYSKVSLNQEILSKRDEMIKQIAYQIGYPDSHVKDAYCHFKAFSLGIKELIEENVLPKDFIQLIKKNLKNSTDEVSKSTYFDILEVITKFHELDKTTVKNILLQIHAYSAGTFQNDINSYEAILTFFLMRYEKMEELIKEDQDIQRLVPKMLISYIPISLFEIDQGNIMNRISNGLTNVIPGTSFMIEDMPDGMKNLGNFLFGSLIKKGNLEVLTQLLQKGLLTWTKNPDAKSTFLNELESKLKNGEISYPKYEIIKKMIETQK